MSASARSSTRLSRLSFLMRWQSVATITWFRQMSALLEQCDRIKSVVLLTLMTKCFIIAVTRSRSNSFVYEKSLERSINKTVSRNLQLTKWHFYLLHWGFDSTWESHFTFHKIHSTLSSRGQKVYLLAKWHTTRLSFVWHKQFPFCLLAYDGDADDGLLNHLNFCRCN